MDINIRPLTQFEGSGWEVRLNRISIKCRTESEARDYAHTLETRLTASHILPVPQRPDSD